MIFYFYGKDRFLVKLEAEKKIRELENQGFKKTVLENLTDAKEAVKAGSLFSEKRFFVWTTEKLDEAEKKQFKEIDFSKTRDELIFVEKNTAPSLLFGRVKVKKNKVGEVNADWLKNQAKELGIELKKDLVDYFLSGFFKDSDAGFFYFEILKLSLFEPGGDFDLKKYQEISQGKQEISYFDWIKAVLEKNTALALKFIPEDIGEAMMRFKSLQNTFELLLVAEDPPSPASRRASEGQVQKEFLAKANPYWVANLKKWASKMSYPEKQAKFNQLLDLEIKFKTGQLGVVEAIKLFTLG